MHEEEECSRHRRAGCTGPKEEGDWWLEWGGQWRVVGAEIPEKVGTEMVDSLGQRKDVCFHAEWDGEPLDR